MKSCSGKPCNEQGDCEHCNMADGPERCPKCGSEMKHSWDQPIYPDESSDEPCAWIHNYHCYQCGHNAFEKTECGHEEKVEGEK